MTAKQLQRRRIAHAIDQATVQSRMMRAVRSSDGYILVISPKGNSFEWRPLTVAG